MIVDDGSDWRMADVIWVDGGARNPKVPTLFQVADVDTGIVTWVNADLIAQGWFTEPTPSARLVAVRKAH